LENSQIRPPTDFPHDASGIRSDWLTTVLQENGTIGRDVSVRSVESKQIGDGLGQTGEVARLILTYNTHPDLPPGAPASLIAKFATSNDARRKASVATSLYVKEVDFYQNLADKISLRSPKSYFAKCDAVGEFFLLLLEDFPHHRAGDQIAGSDLQEATLGMQQLASLHGPFWNKPAPTQTASQQNTPSKEILVKGWPEMERWFSDYMSPEFRSMKNAYLESVEAFEAWNFTKPQTLRHGDFKADNLLFSTTNEVDPVVALDWQAIAMGKATVDLAYFITHNMTVEHRKAYERELLEIYLNALQGYGVDYSMSELLTEYRIALVNNLKAQVYICGVNVNQNPRAILRKQHLMRRVSSSIEDWRLGELLPFKAS